MTKRCDLSMKCTNLERNLNTNGKCANRRNSRRSKSQRKRSVNSKPILSVQRKRLKQNSRRFKRSTEEHWRRDPASSRSAAIFGAKSSKFKSKKRNSSPHSNKLKQEQQDHSNTDMRALTDSIAKIQSARDELQARAEVHQQELKQLQERTDLERNEFDVWLEKEKSQRITAEKELRETQLSFDAQRNELAHARHRMGALETTVTDWKGQADALRADHRATVERLLGRHADNLQGLERTIGQKDQKIMLLLQQIGSQDLVVSQLKEAKSRQEASLSKAFSSLQQAFPALDGLSSSPETRDPVATDTHRARRSTRTKKQRVSRRRSGTKIGSETVKMVSESEF
eukprot:761715_1